MNQFETFMELHRQSSPFLLGNIWDVSSALVFEANGYKAIGTSSMAVARSMGLEDGENLPFDSLVQLAARVTERVRIPLTVDMEGGYSRNVEEIGRNIERLHDAGVVGINLEDTVAGAFRRQLPVEDFQRTLGGVAEYISRKNLKIFLNIRTDGYLLGMPDALAITLERIKWYKEAGADGIFVPCITEAAEIREVVDATHLPVNVMCMPGLPDFRMLGVLGVRRISMGSFLFDKVNDYAGVLARSIRREMNFSSIIHS